MSEVKREHLAGLELFRKEASFSVAAEIVEQLDALIAQASAAPVKTTSDQYRAELYDEMFEKARSMGFGNIIGALTELERMKASAAPEQEAVAAFENCIDARAYIAGLFKQRLRRHDFQQYITERLAGDFAFALANWLDSGCYPSAEIERLRAENKRLLSAGQALEADFSSYRREVEHKDEACTRRADAADQQLADAQALLRRARQFVEDWDDDSQEFIDLCGEIDNALSATAQPAECQHRYMYFGTQPARRCADCNKVEPAEVKS